MRTLAVGAGVVGYLLFAALVGRLFAADPAAVVALAPCPGSQRAATDWTPPFYHRLDAPDSVSLCGSFLGAPPLLVLPRVSGNWLEVRIDGRQRLSLGSPDRPANLWMTPHLVRLGELDAGREHRVEVRLGGLYDLGVRVPPYLADWSRGAPRVALLRWLTDDLVALATGVCLGICLLLFAYGLRRRGDDRTEYLLYCATAIAASLYMLDFLPADGFFSVPLFLARRKLSLSAAYFTVACLTAGLERTTRVERRAGPVFLGLATILSVLAWIQPDAAALKQFSGWAGLTLIVVPLWGVTLAVRRLEPVYAALWVFFGCSTIHTLVNLLSDTSHLYLLHYGLLAGTLAAGVRTTSHLTGLARALDRASRAALTDPLTGAWNRAYCERIRLDPGDSVAVIDFDDFKRVNDAHGHERGDQLLIAFVRAARSRLRRVDEVVRLGGDEFVLVLRGVDPRIARSLCDEVLAEWKLLSPDLDPSASTGLVEVGSGALAFHEILSIADHRMYGEKQPPRPRL